MNTLTSYSRFTLSCVLGLTALLMGSLSVQAQDKAPASWPVPTDASSNWKVVAGHDTDAAKAGVQAGAEPGVLEFRYGFLGDAALAFAYNEYVYNGSPEFAAMPKFVTLEIKEPAGSGGRAVAFRFEDAAGTRFHWGFPIKSSSDWQPYRIELKQSGGGFSAWNADVRDASGKLVVKPFDVVPPVKFLGVVIDRKSPGDKSSGTVSFKGLAIVE